MKAAIGVRDNSYRICKVDKTEDDRNMYKQYRNGVLGYKIFMAEKLMT